MPISAEVSAAKWELEAASAAALRPLCEARGGKMGLESPLVRTMGSQQGTAFLIRARFDLKNKNIAFPVNFLTCCKFVLYKLRLTQVHKSHQALRCSGGS